MASRTLRFSIPTVFLALAILGRSAPAEAARIDRHFHERFAAQAGATLHLQHGDGDVEIRAGATQEIVIDVVYRREINGIGLGDESDFQVEMESSNGDVFVRERRDHGWSIGLRFSKLEEYVYRIELPAGVHLDLEGDDGDVHIEGVAGDLKLRLDDGDVDLRDSEFGRAVLVLEDGDVVAEACSGDFDLTLDDGDVAFRKVRTPTLVLRAEDGEIHLDLEARGAVDWRVRTDDGDVDFRLPRTVDARVMLQTEDGRLRWRGLEHVQEDRDYGRARAVLGQGEGRIDVETDDGDVSVEVTGATEG